MAAQEIPQHPKSELAPRTDTPAPGPSWWMLSGIMVGIGCVLIGVGFIVLGWYIVSSGDYTIYVGSVFGLIGVGIIFLGVSSAFARMTPRMK